MTAPMTPARLAEVRAEVERRRRAARLSAPNTAEPTVLVPDGLLVEVMAEVDRLATWKAWAERRVGRAQLHVEEGGEVERELRSALAGPHDGWQP